MSWLSKAGFGINSLKSTLTYIFFDFINFIVNILNLVASYIFFQLRLALKKEKVALPGLKISYAPNNFKNYIHCLSFKVKTVQAPPPTQ